MEKIPENIKQEIEQLVKDLNYHCHRYHVQDDPEISDEKYDSLYRRLKELEENTDYVLPDSPTQRVGAPPLKEFGEVKHVVPMLSLDNAISYDQVREFDQRTKRNLKSVEEIMYTVEPKYDGFAIELMYKNGILEKASTRGDGVMGEDVTLNIKTIKAVPLRIEDEDVPAVIDIRGEVYMSIRDFETLNREREKQGESTFANPRNAASGSVRQLDSSIMATRKFSLACYGVGRIKGKNIKNQWELIQWLKKARFPIPSMKEPVKGIEKVIQEIRKIEEQRKDFPFEADGAVIKVNDFSIQQTLGVKTREPRWAIAYKFKAHRGITRIVNIEPSVGRQGAITPVANFEPVSIGGVTVSRASLHNCDEIQRKDIRVGDYVEVERAGEVIPHVVSVLIEKRSGKEKPYSFDLKCPACDSPIIREEGEVAFKCINLNCSAQAKEKIIKYASRTAMDIEGLGEKNVELLYSARLIDHFVDLYKLKKVDLLRLPGFAEKSAQSLIDSIESSKKTSLFRFINSLGINYVGESSAKLLANEFEVINDLYQVKVKRLKKIEQIGDKAAISIANFFNDKENINALKSLKHLGLELLNPDFISTESDLKAKKSKKLLSKGLTFVITGKLPKGRAEVEKYIEGIGGHNSKSISRKTDYLVVGENPKSKLNKARELDVKIITYEELMKLSKEEIKGK